MRRESDKFFFFKLKRRGVVKYDFFFFGGV